MVKVEFNVEWMEMNAFDLVECSVVIAFGKYNVSHLNWVIIQYNVTHIAFVSILLTVEIPKPENLINILFVTIVTDSNNWNAENVGSYTNYHSNEHSYQELLHLQREKILENKFTIFSYKYCSKPKISFW